jgi:hypothetical protein
MPEATRSQQATRLDEVRKVLRLHHDSMHTERSSVDWIVQFVHFHGMRSRDALCPAEPTIESFLTGLAVQGSIAATAQNQAMHTLVCLDTRVLTNRVIISWVCAILDTDVKIILVSAVRLLRGSGASHDSPGSPDV